MFAGAGVAPVIAAPIYPAACPPATGGIVFDGSVGGGAGGVYGPGFGPGSAAGGLDVAPPAPAVNYGPGYDHQNAYGGSFDGGAVGAAPAGTPVPRGCYLTPDGRLVDGAGNPVDGGDFDAGGTNGGIDVQPAPAPLGPTGRPLNDPGLAPGMNAPGLNGDGGGEPIPPGSTFGPDGAVFGPHGALLSPGRSGGVRRASYATPAHGPSLAYGGELRPRGLRPPRVRRADLRRRLYRSAALRDRAVRAGPDRPGHARLPAGPGRGRDRPGGGPDRRAVGRVGQRVLPRRRPARDRRPRRPRLRRRRG